MIALRRLTEPEPLKSKSKVWLKNFLETGNDRPQNSQYGHKNVRMQLDSMSHQKCFYCESKLKGEPKEVDHHIEVSVKKELSFDWNNLYLSCTYCNKKVNHNDIPIDKALNPCSNDDSEIQEHLTFNNELIQPNNNSELGLNTINKYRLDNDVLDLKRSKALILFQSKLLQIQNNRIKENRDLLQEEIEIINCFKRKDNPYSLMFKVLIDNIDI